MTAEQYFSRLIYTSQRINANIEELKRLRALMSGISSPNLDGPPNGKGKPHSKVETLAVKFADLDADISEEILDLVDMEREARDVLQQIENQPQRIVLQEYYLNQRSIEEISASLYLTYRRVQQLKTEGLKTAQKIIDKRQHEIS